MRYLIFIFLFLLNFSAFSLELSIKTVFQDKYRKDHPVFSEYDDDEFVKMWGLPLKNKEESTANYFLRNTEGYSEALCSFLSEKNTAIENVDAIGSETNNAIEFNDGLLDTMCPNRVRMHELIEEYARYRQDKKDISVQEFHMKTREHLILTHLLHSKSSKSTDKEFLSLIYRIMGDETLADFEEDDDLISPSDFVTGITALGTTLKAYKALAALRGPGSEQRMISQRFLRRSAQQSITEKVGYLSYRRMFSSPSRALFSLYAFSCIYLVLNIIKESVFHAVPELWWHVQDEELHDLHPNVQKLIFEISKQYHVRNILTSVFYTSAVVIIGGLSFGVVKVIHSGAVLLGRGRNGEIMQL